MIQPLNVLSCFAGIGMIDLGFERAGCRIVGQIEIEEYCRRVLAKHWPDVWRYGDLKELLNEPRTGEFILDGCGVDRIDILTGGVPCQPASVAGKRGGTKDTRWLWPQFLSLVRAVRPLYVLAENPCEVLGVDIDGVRFREWITLQFQTLGFEVFPVVLGAESVGAPHKRERLWLLAYAKHGGREWRNTPFARTGATLPQSKRVSGDGQAITAGDRRGERRPESARIEGGSDAALCGHAMADPGSGRRYREQEGQGAGQGRRERLAAAGKELDHPAGPRSSGAGEPAENREIWDEGRWLQPRLRGCELVDASRIGLAQYLRQSGDDGEELQAFARTNWPMGQGYLQYEWEEPRIVPKPTVGTSANGHASGLARWSRTRRAAVKAIGNGAIPQIAEILARTIQRFIEYQYQEEKAD